MPASLHFVLVLGESLAVSPNLLLGMGRISKFPQGAEFDPTMHSNWTLVGGALSLVVWCAAGCSNFMLSNPYHLSVRTMDLGTPLDFVVATSPIGTKLAGRSSTTLVSSIGFVGIIPQVGGVNAVGMNTAGMNTAGVSCDEQTLLGTAYPNKTHTPRDLDASYFCQWVLSSSTSAGEVKAALLNGSTVVVADTVTNDANGQHWSVRDATGASIVVECVGGVVHVYDDGNDGGKSGFGIMTNEPQWPWHVQNVQHYIWKQTMVSAEMEREGGGGGEEEEEEEEGGGGGEEEEEVSAGWP
jgi:penicillin V acylase-like amidase (Ntn superfamily)